MTPAVQQSHMHSSPVLFLALLAAYIGNLRFLGGLQMLLLLHGAAGEIVAGQVVERKEGKKEESATVLPQPPPPEEYLYHQHVESDTLVREYLLQEIHPRSALMCPKGLAIAKISMKLRVGKDLVEAHPEARLTAPFTYWLVQTNNGKGNDEEEGPSRCPTLHRCLGYQACLFTFGIEFCNLDPLPGQRKFLLVTVTCMRDEALLKGMRDAYQDAVPVNEVARRSGLVLHLTYTSHLEEGVQDLSSTVISEREEGEGEIFYAMCHNLQDITKSGYRGQCHTEPPASEVVSEALWSLLGRVPSRQCREELQEIYCSFQYHSKGLCVPPFLVAPSQVSGVDPEDLKFNDVSLPKMGPRPPPLNFKKPPGPLHPAGLAFVILVHKDPPAVMQLLSLIYRPHHFYVLHVDQRATHVRRALNDLLLHLMPGASNVRILPASRSFVASWGSYNIVRAELEAFEELLRMGHWDFAINLSGADLPLRDVDDLAATLAPYRGTNFVPIFTQRNKNMKADQGLAWDVWHGCEGYVYNVTRGGGQPEPQELLIYTGSQWSIMSHELVNYAVTPALRSQATNRWQFYLQTSIIPDESYFPTLTHNSPFVNATRHLGFHWLKRFEGRNTLNLCRHMEDTDFCGQGPGPITEEDLYQMFESSHRYFFARKFNTNSPTHATRVKVNEHMRIGYYQNLRTHLSRDLMHQLLTAAHVRLVQKHLVKPSTRPGNLLSLRVLPVLHLTNPCCSLPFQRSFKSIQEFVTWLDFTFVDAEGWSAGVARAAVWQQPPFDCYPDGHLRALRVTTWQDEVRRTQLSINIPLPFAAPGADSVHVEMWFHVGPRSLSPSCLAGEGRRASSPGIPMHFPDLKVENVTAQPLEIVIQLVDPQGSVRCEERRKETWEESRIHPNADGERVELASFFTLLCGLMESGLWTVRVFQSGLETPRRYELTVGVLPRSWATQEPTPDLLMSLWRVGEVAVLPLDDGGEKAKKEKEKKNEGSGEEKKSDVDEQKGEEEFAEKEEERKMVEEQHQHSLHERSAGGMSPDLVEREQIFRLDEWLVCGGGLLTATLAVVFTYHWVVVPALMSVRASPRMQRSALLVLCAVLLQIFVTSSFCR
ncbi:uncharacterized protein LOC123520188 [Portunus trituberculatus]|uniref:uncharacterized protein LOC123520188 n=1 Tax=Portunus trituberculatus TaxID=210409 RepID=UPI001E1D1B89|nr:uncharacterized protein LOC123520188 [Portunus trituberculatus]